MLKGSPDARRPHRSILGREWDAKLRPSASQPSLGRPLSGTHFRPPTVRLAAMSLTSPPSHGAAERQRPPQIPRVRVAERAEPSSAATRERRILLGEACGRWLGSFDDERAQFASLLAFGEHRWTEADEWSETLGRPNTLSIAACVQLLSHVVCRAGPPAALGQTLLGQLVLALYSDVDRWPEADVPPSSVGAHLREKVPYFELLPEMVKRLDEQKKKKSAEFAAIEGVARNTARNSARNSSVRRGRGGARSRRRAPRRTTASRRPPARPEVGVVGGGEHVTSFETFMHAAAVLSSHSLSVNDGGMQASPGSQASPRRGALRSTAHTPQGEDSRLPLGASQVPFDLSVASSHR